MKYTRELASVLAGVLYASFCVFFFFMAALLCHCDLYWFAAFFGVCGLLSLVDGHALYLLLAVLVYMGLRGGYYEDDNRNL